jgi:hypothetical protein
MHAFLVANVVDSNANPRKTREGWPLLTVETEAWGLKEYKGPSLVGSLGLSRRYKICLSCLGCFIRPCTKYFFSSPYTIFTSFVSIAQQAEQTVVPGHLSPNMCLWPPPSMATLCTACTCHTERRETEREERKVAIVDILERGRG